jgi:hypothetical protein
MSKHLWLPEYAGELLCVTVDPNMDDFEFQGMLQINAAAFDWLDGRLDTGTYFDTLDHYGLDPIEFVEPVIELYEFE